MYGWPLAALTSIEPFPSNGPATAAVGVTMVNEPAPSELGAALSLQAPAGKSTSILPLVGNVPVR